MELPGDLPDQVIGKNTPARRQFIILLTQGLPGDLENNGINHPGLEGIDEIMDQAVPAIMQKPAVRIEPGTDGRHIAVPEQGGRLRDMIS